MKVLFVAGGRRISLAQRFIYKDFQVFSYETETNCPITKVGKIIVGKQWQDNDIDNHLIDVIRSYNIDLIIPLADNATSLLSRMIKKYPELIDKVPTGSEETNNICLNKKIFEKELIDYDFYPKFDYSSEYIIAKPIFGANSKGIKIIDKNTYILDKYYYDDNYVIQNYIKNGIEISVDAYFDKHSKMIDAIPRKRIEVQGGEVNRSCTLSKEAFGAVDITKLVGEKIRLVGPICAQFISNGNKTYIMEINARFGGGVILSLEAGLDIINLIKQEYMNNSNIDNYRSNWKVGLCMTRYFKEHFY